MKNLRHNNLNIMFPQTAAVLFDGGYWNNIRHMFGAHNIDLTKLSDELCQPAYRLRTYYFDGKDNQRQSFHDGLRLLPRFEVILGDVVERTIQCQHCQKPIVTKEQKRVDVQLAVQMVHLATTQQVNLIVLIAGDRDFIPSVQIAKHSGVIVRLIHGPKMTTSTDLRQLADETIELTDSFLLKFLHEVATNKISRPKIRSKPRISASSKINKKITEESKELLVNALINTPTIADGSILGSSLGITLSRIEPNWKMIYGVKSLSDFIKLSNKEIFNTKRKGKVLYLYPNVDLIPKNDINKDQGKKDHAVGFLLQALKELQKEKKTKMIRLSVLGLYLAKKNPNWKKDYHIKKLDDLVEKVGEKVLTLGEGVEKKVGLTVNDFQ